MPNAFGTGSSDTEGLTFIGDFVG
ncbi:hypothetical protein YPPY32_1757, partial [Yersinia pestis PY-32]